MSIRKMSAFMYAFSSLLGEKKELPKRKLNRDKLGELCISKVVVKGPSSLSIKAGQLLVSSMKERRRIAVHKNKVQKENKKKLVVGQKLLGRASGCRECRWAS